jgi:hypothetical protein
VNEGRGGIENCVKCEAYGMAVECIEVWTLFAVFAVRYYPRVLHSL